MALTKISLAAFAAVSCALVLRDGTYGTSSTVQATHPLAGDFEHVAGSYKTLRIADLDGDGRSDIAFVSTVANEDGYSEAVTVLFARSNGSFVAGGTFPAPDFAGLLDASDVDDDGDIDLTATGPDGKVSVLVNAGHGMFRAKE